MTGPRAREQAGPPSPPAAARRVGGPSSQAVSEGSAAGVARLLGARRGLLRSARALAAAALLALTGALALPATAEAQTAVTLVSNTGQDDDGSHSFARGAGLSQRFDTGDNADGYTLTGVDVVVSQSGGDDFRVQVCSTDSSGHPTSDCTNLTAPSSFPKGTASFTAQANTTLTSGTTYAAVVDDPDGTNRVETTLSDNEDSGKATGWSIANALVSCHSSNVG